MLSLARAILFIGVIIGVIAIVTVIVFYDTNGASRLQSISSSAPNQNDNDKTASTPSNLKFSPGLTDNSTNVIPKEAYDPYPYP